MHLLEKSLCAQVPKIVLIALHALCMLVAASHSTELEPTTPPLPPPTRPEFHEDIEQ